MTTFFPADDGYHYPISSIERFRLSHDDRADPILKVDIMPGGGTVTVTGRGADIVLRSSAVTVQAAPDTFYVGIDDESSPKSVVFYPVIAWLVPVEREPLPVTIHGIEGGVDNRYVILLPNGSISDFGMSDHVDLVTYLRSIDFNDDEIGVAQMEAEQAFKRPYAG